MAYETILFALDRDVATITLNRPDRMNALTRTMRRELVAAVARATETARVVVLTGAGRAFCSGQDLGDSRDAGAIDLAATLRDEYEPCLLYTSPSPRD